MNNKDEFISVSKFAKKVNLSRQTIYNRLDSDLTSFVKEDLKTGKKMIDIKALKLFNDGLSNVKNDVNKVVKFDKRIDNYFQVELEFLRQELQAKNDQIAKLNDQLDTQLEKKDTQISELNQRLAESQELNRNQQILLKNEQEKLLLIENTQEEGLFKRLFKKK